MHARRAAHTCMRAVLSRFGGTCLWYSRPRMIAAQAQVISCVYERAREVGTEESAHTHACAHILS
eukprot:1983985-Pleurochrysis_carterae.AAC.2